MRPVARASLLLISALLCTLLPLPADAQSATGDISGTVVDESGGAVVGAEVVVSAPATGLERRLATRGTGAFSVPRLPPGEYTISATAPGFSPTTLEGLVVNVNDARAVHIELRVGGVVDVVTVEATPVINESPAVATTVERRFVEGLPLNGRTFQSLIALAPGVVPVPTSADRFGQFSVNGQRDSANAFTVDGVSANIGVSVGRASPFGGGGQQPGFNAVGGTMSLVPVDAMQEFTVQTSSYAPEYGRSPGGQVAIVTRSGTNAIRGSVFSFMRHEALDATDWFAKSRNLGKSELRNQQFGGVVGGPLVRNRTFFFAAYEGLRLRLPQTGVRPVPTRAAREQAVGPVRELLEAFPQPTGAELGDGTAEFAGRYSEPSSADVLSVRLDHRLSPAWSLFGRYAAARTDAETRGNLNQSLSSVANTNVDTNVVTLGSTGILTPRLVNDLRVNYSGVSGGTFTELDTFGGATPLGPSALFPAFATADDSLFRAFFNGFSFALFSGSTARTTLDQINVVDTLSYATGAHQLRFGVDWRWLSPRVDHQSYQQAIAFDTVDAAVNGASSFAFVGAQGEPLNPRFQNLSLFAQDTWRASDRLSLTYGLRWDFNPPPTEANGHDVRTVVGLADPGTMTLAPQGAPLWKTSYRDFAPRAGFAYRLSRSARFGSVLRGGVGMFYDITTGSVASAYDSFAYPHAAARVVVDVLPYPLPPEIAAPPRLTADPPYNYVYGFDPELRSPRTTQWNVALEQTIGRIQTVTVSYVGAAGRRLYRVAYYGSPNSDFQNFHSLTNEDSSDYHALQVQFARRLARGFAGLVSYTWSHATDTSSSDVNVFSGNLPSDVWPVRLDRGDADFDYRHVVSGALSYDLPAPRGHGIGGTFLDGWSLDGVLRASSAPPVTVITNNQGFGFDLRPDLVPNQPLYLDDPNVAGGRRFNPDAFAPPPGDRHGSLGRNVLRGFPAWQLDLALRRRIALQNDVGLQVRVDMFNLFNRANFAPPNGNPDDPFFGQSTQMLNRGLGGLNPLYQIGGPRSIQLGLRVDF